MASQSLSTLSINLANPIQYDHVLAQELRVFCLALPGLMGGRYLHNLRAIPGILSHGQLNQGQHGLLSSMTMGFSSSTSGWRRGTARSGGWAEVRFDGTDDFINCGKVGSAGRSTLTWAVWINRAAGTACLDEWDGVNTGVLLYIPNNGSVTFHVATAANFALTTAAGLIINNKWHHIIVTYQKTDSAADMRIYIDGKLAASSTATNAVNATNTAEFRIGHSTSGVTYFQGAMDGIQVYYRALSASEAALLYNESRAGYPTLLRRVLGRYAQGTLDADVPFISRSSVGVP